MSNKPGKMPVTLRPYQEYFYDETFKAVNDGIKNICIAAYTGTGKTFMSAAIAETFLQNGGIVIFIAPRINLVYQTIKSFKHLGRVQVIQGDRKFDENGKIYIASLFTLVRRILSFTPALIIHDERHHGFSGKASKKVMKKFPNAVYLSLTATPFDSKGHPLKGFDTILKYKTIQWFIDNGYLVDCECYAPVMPDLSKVKITAGDYNEKELDAIMNNKVMIGNIVDKTKEKIVGKKTLFFAVTIAHAEEVAKKYCDVGFKAVAYHSDLNDDYREQIIKDFENGSIDILVSVSALVMGFDVPSVDCLVVARPTKSQSFYRQLIGRGMRPSIGKTRCLLIDCAGVINENGMPNEEVVPKKKNKKTDKKMICDKCGKLAKPISKYVKRKLGKVYYITTWSCDNGHTFDTEQEAGCTICPNCSMIVAPGNAKFEETDSEYRVFAECECGEKIIIRNIPKIDGNLERLKKSKITKVDYINKIVLLTKDDQREKINGFIRYILDSLHPDMQEQCLSSMYVSLDMGLPMSEIESHLKQAVIDASIRTNHFKCLSTNLVKDVYQQAVDPSTIIHLHNSRAVKPMNAAWLNKTVVKLREFESDFPESKKWLLGCIKTRCQNIHQREQKMASLFYFFDYLREKENSPNGGI